MTPLPPDHCIAFLGMRQIASGAFSEVATGVKRTLDSGKPGAILCFDARTSHLLEVDTRGSVEDVARRYAAVPATPPVPAEAAAPSPPEGVALPAGAAGAGAEGGVHGPSGRDLPRGPGRPRLGVVAREVSLLPRHWDWLSTQPGGASVALRKLVEEARRANAGRDAARQSRESAYRFMSAVASGLESFEEATRALFADDRPRFESLLADWPADVRRHALVLALPSFGNGSGAGTGTGPASAVPTAAAG